MKTNKHIQFLLCLVSLFFLLSCSSKDSNVKKKPPIHHSENQEIVNFTLDHTISGKRDWTLNALNAVIDEQSDNISLKILNIDFYENDEKVSHLKADKGNIKSSTNDMHAEGNVRVDSMREDVVILTENLFYKSDERKIYSEDFIKEILPDRIVTGYGLQTDAGLSKILIKKDVVVTMKENTHNDD